MCNIGYELGWIYSALYSHAMLTEYWIKPESVLCQSNFHSVLTISILPRVAIRYTVKGDLFSFFSLSLSLSLVFSVTNNVVISLSDIASLCTFDYCFICCNWKYFQVSVCFIFDADNCNRMDVARVMLLY